MNGNTLSYDAETHPTGFTPLPGTGLGPETYAYDGNGNRVQKTDPTGTTTYIYDAFDQLATEYSASVASSSCTPCYLSYDHLGSVRLVTDPAGTVVSRHDYLPYGEEILSDAPGRNSEFAQSDGVSQRFTGKEHDDSGLDYFGARYYGSALGRFSSADEPLVGQDAGDPQSWKLYSYGRNNPLRYVDPDGHDAADSNDPCHGNPNCVTVTDKAPGLSPIEELFFRSMFNIVQQSMQMQQAGQQAFHWLSQPRNGPCLSASTAAGASAGAAAGMFGLAGGSAVGITEPSAVAIGGRLGWAGGMVSCMSSSGGTGSSGRATGNDKRPKEWQITNPADKKVVGGRTYLKDAKTGTWWSKDTAGHGGSAWKVYKETSPGRLDWIADADTQGNFISGKWKSPVSTSITF